MADCQHLFKKFYSNLIISTTRRENLIKGRDALRKKIENYFVDELGREKPEFREQGSYAQNTIINPPEGGEYDLDDGVYIQDFDKQDQSKWESTETVHKWVLDAVKGHADAEEDKNTCGRVIYKNDYHIDLPIYAELNGIPYIAKKVEGWEVNEPEKLTDWINDKIKNEGDQLRRVVRYFKGWKDDNNKQSKMPNGLYVIVLCIEVFVKNTRDDVSFQKTIRAMKERIAEDDEVKNPVNEDESLATRLSTAQKTDFKNALNTLDENADKAIREDSEKKACEKWKKELGKYFPTCEGCKESGGEDKLITSAPAILRDDKRSA